MRNSYVKIDFSPSRLLCGEAHSHCQQCSGTISNSSSLRFHCRLDIPWWEKLLGTSFKGGRCQLKQLSGGKMDDITVLIAYVAEVGQLEDGYGIYVVSGGGYILTPQEA
eukprot:scaffold74395_cov16-Tisochrysis_lutea.AAC.1